MTHFNQVANTWDTQEKIDQNKKYADIIKETLNKSNFENVLEVGCGTGLLGSNFVENNTHFLGIDTSDGMLEVFDQKFQNSPNVKSLNLNLEEKNLTEINSQFDLIISSMAFHHIKDPQSMLLKLKRLLTQNGAIAIIDLDKEEGTFHPDPKKMGVHHFGFSESETKAWAKHLDFVGYHRQVINIFKKETGDYPIFLATYLNK